MHKVRPYWGHDDHIHIRLACPAGASACEEQEPPPDGDGCAEKDLAYWFQPGVLHPTPRQASPALAALGPSGSVPGGASRAVVRGRVANSE